MSVPTIRASIKRLEKEKYITVKKKGRKIIIILIYIKNLNHLQKNL